MTHETAGDPVSGLKWTHRTTAKLAHELRGLGIHVCPQTVARLLKAMGYSLRVNHKKLAGASHPNRDQQFRHHRVARALRRRQHPGHQRRYPSAPSAIPARSPQPRTRQRPRLPLRCRGPRHPLRHYDPSRHRLRRHRRHPGVRRRLHPYRGPQALRLAPADRDDRRSAGQYRSASRRPRSVRPKADRRPGDGLRPSGKAGPLPFVQPPDGQIRHPLSQQRPGRGWSTPDPASKQR